MGQGFGLWLGAIAAAAVAGYLLDPSRYTFIFEPGRFLALATARGGARPAPDLHRRAALRRLRAPRASGCSSATPSCSRRSWASCSFPGHIGVTRTLESFGSFLAAGGYSFVVGAFFAFITLLDNGLELALGVHAANNLFIDLLFDYETGWIPTPALFTVSNPDPGFTVYNILSFLVMAAVFYLLAFRLTKKPGKKEQVE